MILIETIRGLTGIKRTVLAGFCGAITALALAPLHLVPVCFVSFPILLLLLDGLYADANGMSLRQYAKVALTGWSFGFGYFVAGLWWLGNAVLVEGVGASSLMLPLAVLGLPATLALYWGGATLLQAMMARTGYGRIVALAAAFMIMEWLRGTFFTGFPWNAIGYTAMPSPLWMQIAALIGLDGVNALAVLVYATPVLCTNLKPRGNRLGLVIAGGLIFFSAAFGAGRLYGLSPVTEMVDAEGVRVRIVQPSIAQSDKQTATRDREIFDQHLHLTRQPPPSKAKRPDLIVWPETAVPYILAYEPQAVEMIGKTLQEGQLALVGTVRAETQNPTGTTYYNAMEVIDSQGRLIGHADKTHLVPFGEYLPFQSLFARFGLGGIAETVGGYSAAKFRTSLRLNESITILPLICYEAIFPHELAYQGSRANVMINISNDAWYGATPGPAQHFHQARLRTVEQGMGMIRAANNGISAVLDPYGRIVAQLALDEVGFIDATIPQETVPIWYEYYQNLPVFCLFFILVTISCNITTFLNTHSLIGASNRMRWVLCPGRWWFGHEREIK